MQANYRLSFQIQTHFIMNNSIIRFGVSSGLIGAILFLGPFVIDPEISFDPESMARGEILGYGAMFLSMTLVFFGVRARRNETEGPFTFLEALKTGILITLVSVLVFYLGNVALYEFINPDFLTTFFEGYREYSIETGVSEEEIAQMDASSTMFTNGWLYAILMASSTLLMGLAISLMSALIQKRK